MLPTSPLSTPLVGSSPGPPPPKSPEAEVRELFGHLRAIVTEWPASSSPLPSGLFQFAIGDNVFILDFRTSNYEVHQQSKTISSTPSQPIECTISTSPEDFIIIFGAPPKGSSSLMSMVLGGRVGFQGNPRSLHPLKPLFIAARKRAISMDRSKRKGSSIQILNPNHSLKFRGPSDPHWVPDSAVSCCHLCLDPFTFYNRRHHCRLCSLIFCSKCSSFEILRHRVCETCFQGIQQRLEIIRAKKSNFHEVAMDAPSASVVSATESAFSSSAARTFERSMGSLMRRQNSNGEKKSVTLSESNRTSRSSTILSEMASSPTAKSNSSNTMMTVAKRSARSSASSTPIMSPMHGPITIGTGRSRLVSDAVRPRSLLAEPLSQSIQSWGKDPVAIGPGGMSTITHLMGGNAVPPTPTMPFQTPPHRSAALTSTPSLTPLASSMGVRLPSSSALSSDLHTRANNWTLLAIQEKLKHFEKSKRSPCSSICSFVIILILSFILSLLFTVYFLSCAPPNSNDSKASPPANPSISAIMSNTPLAFLVTSMDPILLFLSNNLHFDLSIVPPMLHASLQSFSSNCVQFYDSAHVYVSQLLATLGRIDVQGIGFHSLLDVVVNLPSMFVKYVWKYENLVFVKQNVLALYALIAPLMMHCYNVALPYIHSGWSFLRTHRNSVLFASAVTYALLLYKYGWRVTTRRIRVFLVAAYVIGRIEWQKLKDKWRKNKEKTKGAQKKRKNKEGEVEVSEDSLSESDREWESLHLQLATYLFSHIIDLKGFWVKVGQYISSRSDVMPQPYITVLSALQDECEHSPYSHVEDVVKRSFGSPIEDIFSSFNRCPLASASIAQVHEAILKDKNQHVVVKVRHPHIHHLMPHDFASLHIVMSVVAWMEPDYDFRPIIVEWTREMVKELNFVMEASNMKRVRDDMKSMNIDVIIPRCVDKLISERVLVMEYIDGFKVTDIDKLNEYGVDRLALVKRITQAIAAQIYYFGIFNGDPHSGNLMVQVKDGRAVPVLLDFGLTKELPPKIKNAFALMVSSVADGDFAGLLTSFSEMGLKLKRESPLEDMKELQWALRDTSSSEDARKETQEYLEKKREELMRRPKALRNPIESWPTELVFYMRTTFLLRGLCSALSVRLPYLEILAPYAKLSIINSVPQSLHCTSIIYPSPVLSSLEAKLRILLTRLFEEGDVLGCQVCVYHKAKQIANIAVGVRGRVDPRPVSHDTLFNAFSVTKPVAATVLHMLVDNRIPYSSSKPQQEVSYNRKVAHYWPRFAAHQKDECTVAHLMSHQAGLEGSVDSKVSIDDLCDWAKMCQLVALSRPTSPPPCPPNYHYLSYGFLVGGLVTELTGRSFPTILREQIAVPLGVDKEFFIGCPDQFHSNIATLANGFGADGGPPKPDEIKAMMEELRDRRREKKRKDKERRRSMRGKPSSLLTMNGGRGSKALINGKANGGRPSVSFADQIDRNEKNDDDANSGSDDEEDKEDDEEDEYPFTLPSDGSLSLVDPLLFNLSQIRRACIPSANGHFSARALAKFLCALSNDGAIEGVRLLSSGKAIPVYTQVEATSTVEMPFGAGSSMLQWGKGVRIFDMKNSPTKAWGHSGLGGSMSFVHPATQTAVVVLVNKLTLHRKVATQTLELVLKELKLELNEAGTPSEWFA